ncbi:MAG: HAD-IA family hydrolase [Planctomycetia bacterium]|nr:HAD-IA family hydrolase [Planctomycetia bacterium]
MAGPSPSLVVFDLGGVLVRIARTWAEASRAAGIDPTGRDDPLPPAAREPWVHAYETGAIDRAAFVDGLVRAMDGAYAPAEVVRIHDAWLFGEYAGLHRLFDALDGAGVETAVLSNTNEAHWARMFPAGAGPSAFPSLRRVRHPHASHLLRARKPDAASFRAVEAATGRRGEGVVFFDDLPDNVRGARRAGWTAHLVDPAGDPAAQMLARLGLAGA